MRRTLSILLGLGLVVGLGACKTARTQDQKFFDEVSALSKEEIMKRGETLTEKKDYAEARKYFSFLADSFPNDPLGRKAALRVADTFYKRNDIENLTEAQLRYKDFANRFPNDPERAYALMMLGRCSFQQAHGPLRDLTPLHEAGESFKQVVELFPDSPYAKEARELLNETNETLAEHELLVAQYYANIKAWRGAKQRIDYLLAQYPHTKSAEQARELVTRVDAALTGSGVAEPTKKGEPAGSGGPAHR